MALPAGYSIKKWNATDKNGRHKHLQYAAYFGNIILNKNQQPFTSIKDAQKAIKQHNEYSMFKKNMGSKLTESIKTAKKMGFYK